MRNRDATAVRYGQHDKPMMVTLFDPDGDERTRYFLHLVNPSACPYASNSIGQFLFGFRELRNHAQVCYSKVKRSNQLGTEGGL